MLFPMALESLQRGFGGRARLTGCLFPIGALGVRDPATRFLDLRGGIKVRAIEALTLWADHPNETLTAEKSFCPTSQLSNLEQRPEPKQCFHGVSCS
jgi:hypothetical protein